jgi:hypothetical protein
VNQPSNQDILDFAQALLKRFHQWTKTKSLKN